MDSISTMLVHSKFNDNAKTLIYEETENILTCAYASRSSKQSNILSIFNGKIKTQNLQIFNLKKKEKSLITHLDINLLLNEQSFYYKLLSRNYILNFDK